MIRFVRSAIGIGMRRACRVSRSTEARASVQALFGFQARSDQVSARRLTARQPDRGEIAEERRGLRAGTIPATTRLDGSFFDLTESLAGRRDGNKHFFAPPPVVHDDSRPSGASRPRHRHHFDANATTRACPARSWVMPAATKPRSRPRVSTASAWSWPTSNSRLPPVASRTGPRATSSRMRR